MQGCQKCQIWQVGTSHLAYIQQVQQALHRSLITCVMKRESAFSLVDTPLSPGALWASTSREAHPALPVASS